MYTLTEEGCSRSVAIACICFRKKPGFFSAVIYSILQISFEIISLSLSIFELIGKGVYSIVIYSARSGGDYIKEISQRILMTSFIIPLSPLILIVSIGHALQKRENTLPLFPMSEKQFWIINSTGNCFYSI